MSEGGNRNWRRTELGRDRVKDSPEYQEATDDRRGTWRGREIISRDTPVNGGVYLGGSEREAIVVDDEREGSRREYDRVYNSVFDTVKSYEKQGYNKKDVLLNSVFDTTRTEIPYAESKIEKILDEELGINREDKKVDLSFFISKKAGVCRHQVLLVAYLLERLIKYGQLEGEASVDRNAIPGIGAHTWVRYTSSRGDISIIDASMGYIGTLEDSKKKGGWNYSRPEEMEQVPFNDEDTDLVASDEETELGSDL
ncbi:hypothetical protein HQ524_03575 [Candidatus Uhrbacteria bacterium]|nr:hypothetical protein [Candidatus Uhrbacteria bacterium]